MSKQVMEMALEALEELEYSYTGTAISYPNSKGVEAAIAALKEAIKQKGEPVFVIFDGPPDHNAQRFVEVETADRKSVSVGWEQYGDYWKLGPLHTSAKQAVPDTVSADIALANEINHLTKQLLEIKQQGDPVAYLRNDNPGGHYQVVMSYKGEYGAFPVFTSAPTIPAGWQLVPKEPTPEMIAAAQEQTDLDYRRGAATLASNIYRAMLFAAPEYKGEEK
jgi:uncharacterized protein YbdZ (MbtH family)